MRVSIGRSWTSSRSAIAAQPLQRVVVAVGDRLVGDVAAGHHAAPPAAGSRRAAGGGAASTGSITPELAAPGRDRPRPPARPAGAAASTIGRCGPLSSSRFGVARDAPASGVGDATPTISANGLSSRCLRARSAADRRLVVGAAGEVIAADALDRHDRARRAARRRPPRPRRRRRRAAPRRRRRRRSDSRGPQRRAGVGLGVEAAVARVLVLGAAARRTSRKPAIVVSGRS